MQAPAQNDAVSEIAGDVGTIALVFATLFYAAELATPVQTVTPAKIRALIWQTPPGASNSVIYWGSTRAAAFAAYEAQATTNRALVTILDGTNAFPITNGLHYATGYQLAGAISHPALWPSNRFDRIFLQSSTDLSNWADIYLLSTNYNKPQEFLRLRAELLKWE